MKDDIGASETLKRRSHEEMTQSNTSFHPWVWSTFWVLEKVVTVEVPKNEILLKQSRTEGENELDMVF